MTDALQGQAYWRSLEERAQTPEFQELVEREFAGPAGGWTDPVSRRQFLVMMAASLGLAGISGCGTGPAPAERILPHVRPPEGVTQGQPLYFATAMPMPGDALGLLVKSHEGRPIKIEGNPDHPATPRHAHAPEDAPFGPSNVFAQASILNLYDPHRSGAVTHLGHISTWEAFFLALSNFLRERPQARLRVLTESITSPSQAHLLRQLMERHPQARWHVHEPVSDGNVRAGARLAFGQEVEPHYRLEAADVILALDCDFLNEGKSSVRHHHDFAQRRRVRQERYERMNRLYVVESTPSGTGARADHRVPMRARDIASFARALAVQMDGRFRSLADGTALPVSAAWIEALARDLTAHRGRCLVMAGPGQPAAVHALAYALNEFLGNVGTTVFYTRPATIEPSDGSLQALAQDMDAGRVDALLILGGNPVYTAPVDLAFGERMNRVPLRIHLSLYPNETAELCHWHLPEAHYLESWGDVRAHDGTLSIIQPLIAPLRPGRTASEVLSFFNEATVQPGYALTRAYWQSLFDPSGAQQIRADWEAQGLLRAFTGDFETWWRRALHDGFVPRTQFPAQSVTLRPDWIANFPATPANSNLEVVFRPDPAIYDGRFAENGWLQELPKPLSKITWDNAILLSPATAVRLQLAPADRPEQANNTVVTLTLHERTVEGPLWVQPGQADDSLTVHLGYGRRVASPLCRGVGFNAYAIRTSTALSLAQGATIQRTNRRHALATTQRHHLLENRDIIRAGTVQNPPRGSTPHRISLYDESPQPQTGEQWAMVIDLNLCTSCNACVVACQSENNIPIVGKEEVLRSREMHWLRIDSYYHGASSNPAMYFQPMLCMHCETAPCEVPCPVAATVHSVDGLNEMIYNRCVGTRYCSNNCPYKVRRFNFLQYSDFTTESLRLMRNPDVSVRSRGVMEKCTFCVQRIRTGQIVAQREERGLRDFEVMTACQSACPSGAIVFGDRNKGHASEVGRLQSEPLRYGVLEDLNTRPRTTYLAAMKNPNPAIVALEQST